MCVVSGVCLSVFATALIYAHLFCLFVLMFYLLIKNFSHVWTNFRLQPLLIVPQDQTWGELIINATH